MEPVDPHEAPDYYRVIKDPMGKHDLFLFFLDNRIFDQIKR